MIKIDWAFYALSQLHRRIHTTIAVAAKRVISMLYQEPEQVESAYQLVFWWLKKVHQLTHPFAQQAIAWKRDLLTANWREQARSRQLQKLFTCSPIAFKPRVLILASGEGTRWDSSGHKQLAKINGRPVIEHTLAKIKRKKVVVSHHPKLQVYPHTVPSQHQFILETLLSTQSLWSKRTIIVLGDVFFGKNDLQKVLDFRGDFAVFGSSSQVEIFAISFTESQHEAVKKHLLAALADAYDGGRGKLWEFYHSFVGMPLYRIGIGNYFSELQNSTDVDTIEDYFNLVHHRQPKSPLGVNSPSESTELSSLVVEY